MSTTITTTFEWLPRLRDAVRVADSAAFAVEPRVVRRVISEEHNVARIAFQVPHSLAYVIPRNRMRGLVHPDELGLRSWDEIPERVILISAPTEKQFERMQYEDVLLRSWRLLFHARIDLRFSLLRENDQLTDADIRRRIDDIGQVEFDEIARVLARESLLFEPDDPLAAYCEFAAIYFEFLFFSPEAIDVWFPSIEDRERIENILRQDVDPGTFFTELRLDGAAEPDFNEQDWLEGVEAKRQDESHIRTNASENPGRFRRLMRRSERAGARGNSVSAAVFALQASECAPVDDLPVASAKSLEEIDRLVQRLQAALGFDDEAARAWHRAIVKLLRYSIDGFWNSDKKLLYDLQKVCVDFERDTYSVDLVKWIVSLGKIPIKRPLPNQREVMMSKHLSIAASRLPSIRIGGEDREQLARLLHEAAASAETQMRNRLRPLLEETLHEVDVRPEKVPEKVACKKLVEEALDCVAERGYLTMGYLRDSLSRQQYEDDGPVTCFRNLPR